MSNYYATARSNYFAVKDEKAFRQWAEQLGLTVLAPDHRDKDADGIRRYGIAPGNGGDSGAWPNSRYHADTDEDESIDLPMELSAHLAEGEVAVLMEVGNEGMRYTTGYALAVNGKGKTTSVSLESIYAKARKLGGTVTRAEY